MSIASTDRTWKTRVIRHGLKDHSRGDPSSQYQSRPRAPRRNFCPTPFAERTPPRSDQVAHSNAPKGESSPPSLPQIRRVWAGFLIANVTTDGSDRRTEISTQGDHESDVVEASTESTLQRSCHLRRLRNFLASPLLRLPTELVLKIFVHTTEPDDDASDSDSSSSSNDGPTLLVLTASCHQLREMGITCPGLWSTVDLTIPPPPAELFREAHGRLVHLVAGGGTDRVVSCQFWRHKTRTGIVTERFNFYLTITLLSFLV